MKVRGASGGEVTATYNRSVVTVLGLTHSEANSLVGVIASASLQDRDFSARDNRYVASTLGSAVRLLFSRQVRHVEK